MNVRPGTEADAATAAALHADQIGEGFLPTLGRRFLTRLYRRIVRSPRSFLFVAEEDGAALGMAAATEDVGALYREFALRDGIVAGALAAPRIVRSWRRVWETFRYPAEHAELPAAELLAVAVAPAARGRGVGRALVAAVNDELSRRGVTAARVVTASTNRAALGLYEAAGYRRAATVQVHAGVSSEVLTWS
jgi:ribosomal protein S18 acetylase RimI-like enzyme